MQKQRYSLIELARDLKKSIEELIDYGSAGELTLHVIADKWPGKKAGVEKTNVIVNGPVELLPADLLQALNAEHTEVRQVKMSGDVVVLDSPQMVMRGRHFVMAAERDRVCGELRPASQSTMGASEDTLPPYLNPKHDCYSYTLEAAISAWMAMYVEGGFVKRSRGDKPQIQSWLKEHRPEVDSDYAREAVARVANPNKGGGNPKTKKS